MLNPLSLFYAFVRSLAPFRSRLCNSHLPPLLSETSIFPTKTLFFPSQPLIKPHHSDRSTLSPPTSNVYLPYRPSFLPFPAVLCLRGIPYPQTQSSPTQTSVNPHPTASGCIPRQSPCLSCHFVPSYASVGHPTRKPNRNTPHPLTHNTRQHFTAL